MYLVYTASSELGSPSVIYNRLLEVASKSRTCSEPLSHHGQSCGPVSGNYKGSYLTMLSSGGLVFGIINIAGNFGTVFVDNVSMTTRCLLICLTESFQHNLKHFLGILGERHCSKTFINTQGLFVGRLGLVCCAIFFGYFIRSWSSCS